MLHGKRSGRDGDSKNRHHALIQLARGPTGEIEKRCPGGDPGQRAVRAEVLPQAVLRKSRPRTRAEGWDERFVIGLAFALAAIVAAAAIYQTIGWVLS
jgi:hypothetical protein